MGCIYELIKVPVGLVGLALTLGGIGGLFLGAILIIDGEDVALGAASLVGSTMALAIGTVLGKFARGDYDQ